MAVMRFSLADSEADDKRLSYILEVVVISE